MILDPSGQTIPGLLEIDDLSQSFFPTLFVFLAENNRIPLGKKSLRIFGRYMNTKEDGRNRIAIRAGISVDIVQKQDQRTGKTARGVVQEILTNSSFHPHGIKVRLADGKVGRVVRIIIEDE